MRLLALALLFVSFAWNANAQTAQWLCAADFATGFSFNAGQWRQATFHPTLKYIVRRTGETWDYREIGDFPISKQCMVQDNFIKCPDMSRWWIAGLVFNPNTLRFTYTYSGSYVGTKPWDSDDSPIVVIGRCVAI